MEYLSNLLTIRKKQRKDRNLFATNYISTILKLAGSRLPDKQKPPMLAANIVNTLTLIQKNQ